MRFGRISGSLTLILIVRRQAHGSKASQPSHHCRSSYWLKFVASTLLLFDSFCSIRSSHMNQCIWRRSVDSVTTLTPVMNRKIWGNTEHPCQTLTSEVEIIDLDEVFSSLATWGLIRYRYYYDSIRWNDTMRHTEQSLLQKVAKPDHKETFMQTSFTSCTSCTTQHLYYAKSVSFVGRSTLPFLGFGFGVRSSSQNIIESNVGIK